LRDPAEPGIKSRSRRARLAGNGPHLARPEQQEKLEWLDGGALAMLLDGKATGGP